MKFTTPEHEKFYNNHADITKNGPEYAAIVYTLGISPTCRAHFKSLFDAEKGLINTGALFEPWQTGASKRITRLAFNLFTWQTAEGDDPEKYAPKELFSNLDADHRQGALLALAYFA